MAITRNSFSVLKRRPVAFVAIAFVVAIILVLSFGRYWITTGPGRDFVLSQLDGRSVAGYGRLSVRKLEGDPLSEFTLRSLEIRDEAGVWFSAQDIRVSWSPLDLISRRVAVKELSVDTASVSRRPKRTVPPDSGGQPWDIQLGAGLIARLTLAEGVAGPETALAISGRFFNERDGAIDTRLLVSPLDGAGDRIEAHIRRNKQSAFDLQIDSVAPAGGVFAHLLRLPKGASAAMTANAAGDLDDGRGEARLTIDGADKAFLSAKIENGTLDGGIRLNAEALPLPASVAQFLGTAAEADVTVQFEKAALKFDIVSRLAAGTVTLQGEAFPNRLALKSPARLQAQLKTLTPFWKGAKSVGLDGTIERRLAGWAYAGDLDLVVLPTSGLPFDSAKGPVTFGLETDRIPFTGNVAVSGAFSRAEGLSDVLGPTVQVSANGVYNRKEKRALLDAFEVTHGSGTVQLLGEVGIGDGSLNVSGQITQAMAALPGGLSGDASGLVQAEGNLRDFELGLNLNVAKLDTNLNVIQPLVQGDGSLRGIVRITPSAGDIRRLEFTAPGIRGEVSGRAYGPGSPNLKILAEQLVELERAGNRVELGSIRAQLTRVSGVRQLEMTSSGGKAFISGRTVEGLTSKAEIRIRDGQFSGPVSLAGRSGGAPASASFQVDRSTGAIQFSAVNGRLGQIDFAGSALLKDAGGLDVIVDLNADAFDLAGVSFGTLRLKGRAAGTAGQPAAISGDFEARNVQVTSRYSIDRVDGTISTLAEGYKISGALTDQQDGANTDMRFAGSVAEVNRIPKGDLAISGEFLGQPIKTNGKVTWTLGPAPTVDADVALLGGRVEVHLKPGNAKQGDRVSLQNLSVAPLFTALGFPAFNAIVSGKANGHFYGQQPQGVLELSADSAVSGLSTTIDLDLTGRVDGDTLAFAGESGFGPELSATLAGRLPLLAAPGKLVALDRARPMEAILDVNGDLDALRLIALAFGHDVGGALKSRTIISGSLGKPVVRADATVSGGRYENGASGLSLKDVDLSANYATGTLSVKGAASGSQGGSLQFTGRLAEDEAGVDLTLNRLLVYDRLGDKARLSGKARLTEEESRRILSGTLTVDDARFNIENVSNGSIRTLNVRWTTRDGVVPRQSILNKPIGLDLKVTASRGVIITGRGLDSDWGVNLSVGGRPDNVLLKGRATLARGSLELARRPFVFDSGQLLFDGPLSTAEFALVAKRDVEGLSVRADVGGTAAKPSIELSSAPSLPEDEILARMLFGRSSVDLTGLEAAELAASLARLTGRSTGLDPLAAIRAGLGVDRLRFGVDSEGRPELGVGQYVASDVYVEVTTQGIAGNSLEVEWQPKPQISVASETSTSGESRISLRWKREY